MNADPCWGSREISEKWEAPARSIMIGQLGWLKEQRRESVTTNGWAISKKEIGKQKQ